MTGYSREELIDRSLSDIWNMLFLCEELPFTLAAVGLEKGLFLFTKHKMARLVDVMYLKGLAQGEYILTFVERPDSRIEDKFQCVVQFLENNCIGVAIYSVPGYILLKANQSYLDCLDEPFNRMENSIGHSIKEIISGWTGSEFEAIWEQNVKAGSAIHLREMEYDGFKRGMAYWDVTISPLYEGGEVRYVVKNIVDVTCQVNKRKAAEMEIDRVSKKLDEAEKLIKLKDEFISYISHEFKTPLTVINAAVQTMQTVCREEMSEKSKRFVKQIKQNSLRLLRLVNNLLEITRSEQGFLKIYRRNLDVVSVTRSIVESVVLYAKEKGITLNFDARIAQKIMALDDEKYERIMLNLLSNAIKFTPPGKSINVKLWQRSGKVSVSVADEGVGIPKEKQHIIFDLFAQVNNELTRETEGTGIGLFLVKLLVDSFGGYIKVESEEGKGSIFTITFPTETICAEASEELSYKADDNRPIKHVDIEFSDIYLPD